VIRPLDKAELKIITGSVSMVPSLTDLAYSPITIPAAEKKKTDIAVIISTRSIFLIPQKFNNDIPPVIRGYKCEHKIKPDIKEMTEENPITDAADILPSIIAVRDMLQLKRVSIVERSFSPALISITLDIVEDAANSIRKTGNIKERINSVLFSVSFRIVEEVICTSLSLISGMAKCDFNRSFTARYEFKEILLAGS